MSAAGIYITALCSSAELIQMSHDAYARDSNYISDWPVQSGR